MRILVLGATGMLGFALHRILHDAGHDVIGTVRRRTRPATEWCRGLRYIEEVDVSDIASVQRVLRTRQPSVVINAAGLIKQVPQSANHESLLVVNSVFPRLLDMDACRHGFRVIQFSTDCVFSGTRGDYDEKDLPDATDPYGVSKFLGEGLSENSLILRTSIIGLGVVPNNSLIDWFLSQTGQVKGFTRAVFSGLPVNEIGYVLESQILPRLESLRGLYHFSAEPIDKHQLLELVRTAWRREDLVLQECAVPVINRGLLSGRLRALINYHPPGWPALVTGMHSFYSSLSN